MKKLLLGIACLMSLFALSQPNIISSLKFGGQREGGSIVRTNFPDTGTVFTYVFDNYQPRQPSSGLLLHDIYVYGMMQYNGTNNIGLFYRIDNDGTNFEPLFNLTITGASLTTPYLHEDHIYFSDYYSLKKFDPILESFSTIPLSQGCEVKRLEIDTDDYIYYSNSSSINRIKTDGTLGEQLYSFPNFDNGNAGLTLVGNKIFGFSRWGGVNNLGYVYSLNKDGTGFMIHHEFESTTGSYPESKLVHFDGKLFGTTLGGGANTWGVLFAMNDDGSNYRVQYHFDQRPPTQDIYINSIGRIFGHFHDLTSPGFERFFRMDTSGADYGTFLYGAQDGGGTNDLVFDAWEEQFYFTTSYGGYHNGGVIAAADTFGIVYSRHHLGFSQTGFNPTKAFKASDGKIYGLVEIAGVTGSGGVFSMNEDGTNYELVYDFEENAHGSRPSGLIEASDGKLYGALQYYGPNGRGSIYRMDKNGSNFQLIFSHSSGADEYAITGDLIEDASGTLFGVFQHGITATAGGVFKINKDGTGFQIIQSFAWGTVNCSSGLTLSGTTLFGSSRFGGSQNGGSVFRIDTDGTNFQVIKEFDPALDGSYPEGKLLIASNDSIYGVTNYGGLNGFGTLYRMHKNGTGFQVLNDFSDQELGYYPQAGLIQASDGFIYGATQTNQSVSGGGGSVFRINLDGSSVTIMNSYDFATEGTSSVFLSEAIFSTLPVVWLSFNVFKADEDALLRWSTSREINSKKFEVQRSSDGTNFQKIGELAAAGSSSSVSHYEFADNDPLSGINFYRLKQIDLDGSFEYSRIVRIHFGKKMNLTVAPNPVNGQLHLYTDVHTRSIRIFDMQGKLVLRHAVNPGVNHYQLNVSGLPAGIFSLVLDNGERTVFLRNNNK